MLFLNVMVVFLATHCPPLKTSYIALQIKGNAISLPIEMTIIYFHRGTSYGMGGGVNFRRGSFNIKSKVLLPFLRVNFESRVTTPPPSTPSFPQMRLTKFFI
jgi:hypothetical protein